MVIKTKDLKRMSKEEREKKLQELKMELIKSKVASQKSGAKVKEIKKMIAKILTLNK
jgi:ribosomal protein L29